MSLVASTANSDGWVQIPCTLSNGVSVSKPIILNFDSGAQFSAIGVSTARQAGISMQNVVGRMPVQGSIGLTNMPIVEVVLSIAGSSRFRTRMILDNETGYNGVIGRNDLNTTHSICFDKNGLVQLYPFKTFRKVSSVSPLQRYPGTVNGRSMTWVFDTGAVGPVASSAISQRVADAAGVTKFVGTEGFKGIGTMEAVTKIAQVVLTVNGSAPFTTYVDVDPQLTEPGLISRQDITRVARVCITPQGYSFTPFSMAQTQPSRTPKSTPVSPTFVAPETSPTPRRIKPVPMAMTGDNTLLLVAGGGVLLIGAVLLLGHRR